MITRFVVGLAVAWLTVAGYAQAGSWSKIEAAPGSANTWRKLTAADGSSSTWRKLGGFNYGTIYAGSHLDSSAGTDFVAGSWLMGGGWVAGAGRAGSGAAWYSAVKTPNTFSFTTPYTLEGWLNLELDGPAGQVVFCQNQLDFNPSSMFL